MRRNIKVWGLNVGIVIFFIFPIFVGAARLVPCSGADCNFCKFAELVSNVIKFLTFNIAFPVSVLSFIAAGVIFMTAGDNASQHEKGKNVFKFTAQGIIIAFAAYAIVNTILGFLFAPGFSLYNNWNHFPSCNF